MQRAVSTVCYYRSLFLQNAHNLDLALSTMLLLFCFCKINSIYSLKELELVTTLCHSHYIQGVSQSVRKILTNTFNLIVDFLNNI